MISMSVLARLEQAEIDPREAAESLRLKIEFRHCTAAFCWASTAAALFETGGNAPHLVARAAARGGDLRVPILGGGAEELSIHPVAKAAVAGEQMEVGELESRSEEPKARSEESEETESGEPDPIGSTNMPTASR